MKRNILIALALMLPSAAMAQNALPNAPLNRFIPGTAQSTMAVSASSTTVPLPATPDTGIPSVLVYNVGANAACITLGDAQVVATCTPSDIPVSPGCFVTAVWAGSTSLAAISPAGPTTLHLFGGTGSPGGGCVN